MTMTEVNSTTINATTSNNTTKNKIKITTSKELIKEEEITLEDLAPDGGWGWMIALAMILIMVNIKLMQDRYNSCRNRCNSLFTNNICLKTILKFFTINIKVFVYRYIINDQ